MIRILEVDRQNLVGKTKAQSPARYNKRKNYGTGTKMVVDFNRLLSDDILVAEVPIHHKTADGHDYFCVISYAGVLYYLLDIAWSQPKPNVTLQTVTRAITKAIDNSDIQVYCSCPDFKYRYAYWATEHGYMIGEPETRPAKIRNPNDNIGSFCKHLTMLLSNKRWLVKLSSVVNGYIRNHIDEVRAALGATEDELYVNEIILFGDIEKKRKAQEEPVEEPTEEPVEEPEEEPEEEEPELRDEGEEE